MQKIQTVMANAAQQALVSFVSCRLIEVVTGTDAKKLKVTDVPVETRRK